MKSQIRVIIITNNLLMVYFTLKHFIGVGSYRVDPEKWRSEEGKIYPDAVDEFILILENCSYKKMIISFNKISLKSLV
jgi:hypothetical protein